MTKNQKKSLPRVRFAYAALFLTSNEGSFINCQDIIVDIGRTAMFNELS